MEKRQEREMENPPLWVWAIVVGLIIAGKYAYRWKTTKQLAKEMERREKGIGLSKDIPDSTIKNNNNNKENSTSNVKTAVSHKYSRHKYSPRSFRDYFEIRKRKVKVKS
jgi:hypothetical protein